MKREPIDQALFARLSASAGFVTTSRRFRHFSDVAPSDQPALFLVHRGEGVQQQRGLPQVSVINYDAIVYAKTGDPSLPPASFINPLIDAISDALAPEPVSNVQTLGGLVQHAWIEGQIETDEGLLQDQGYAIVPISVKAV